MLATIYLLCRLFAGLCLKKSANGETSGREVEREGMKFVAKITAANDIGEFGGFTQTVMS